MARYGKTPLARNRWYHVAGVYDAFNRTLDVYLNGRPDNGCLLGQVTARRYVSNASVFIGRRSDLRGFEFAGMIDDVRIYSRALTPEEVEAETNAHRDSAATKLDTDTISVDSAPGDGPCSVAAPTDGQLTGILVLVGALVGIACVGLWPWTRRRAWSLALSFVAGCMLLPHLVALSFPGFFLLLVPLLSLLGGASVALSSGQEFAAR
jgi:hypothetical protein